MTFWGVRGSIPAPGPATVRYGGNTVVRLGAPGGGELIILDCGTGARNLGISADGGPVRQGRAARRASCCRTPTGITSRASRSSCRCTSRATRFHIYGGAKSSSMLEGILEGQMAPQYFPVQTLKNMGASIDIVAIAEGKPFEVERLPGARAHEPARPRGRAGLPHRGRRRAASSTPATPATPRAARPPTRSTLYRGADVLIHDSTYTPEDQRALRGPRLLVGRGRRRRGRRRRRSSAWCCSTTTRTTPTPTSTRSCARGRARCSTSAAAATSSSPAPSKARRSAFDAGSARRARGNPEHARRASPCVVALPRFRVALAAACAPQRRATRTRRARAVAPAAARHDGRSRHHGNGRHQAARHHGRGRDGGAASAEPRARRGASPAWRRRGTAGGRRGGRGGAGGAGGEPAGGAGARGGSGGTTGGAGRPERAARRPT